MTEEARSPSRTRSTAIRRIDSSVPRSKLRPSRCIPHDTKSLLRLLHDCRLIYRLVSKDLDRSGWALDFTDTVIVNAKILPCSVTMNEAYKALLPGWRNWQTQRT